MIKENEWWADVIVILTCVLCQSEDGLRTEKLKVKGKDMEKEEKEREKEEEGGEETEKVGEEAE